MDLPPGWVLTEPIKYFISISSRLQKKLLLQAVSIRACQKNYYYRRLVYSTVSQRTYLDTKISLHFNRHA